MSAPRRILCPVDFSACAARALDHALAWARATGAELHVLHVVEEGDTREAEAPAGIHEAAVRLGRLLAGRPGADGVVQAVTRGRTAARAIVEHARAEGIDLVVLGTHGRRGFRSLLVGSVTEEVVRTAGCPVLAVPPRPARPDIGLPRRVLVPLDFGPRAPGALRYAKELAARAGGDLLLLHVIEDAIVPDFYFSLGNSLFMREPEARRRSLVALDRLYWEAGGPDVPYEVRVVDGRAGIDIARIASEIAAEAIVMPTHGFAAPDRLVLGSTTDKVLRAAPCPVLVHCTPPPRRARPIEPPGGARRAAPVG